MERDEHMYEYVMEELNNNVKDEAIWIKAYSLAEGLEEKIKPIYIKYRVEFIKNRYKDINVEYTKLSKSDIVKFVNNGFMEFSWIKKLFKWLEDNSINEFKYEEKEDLENRYRDDTLLRDEKELLNSTTLIIGSNDIIKLPKEIFNLTNLKELYIGNCYN
ncbi:MAG: hypothetical protein DRG78_10150 [Epsilonproteobacteria bacterium]|nr:MAG: hypothetical protein DRG78_10150 [Campylobacterota bacterium]